MSQSDLENLTTDGLWSLYSNARTELKKRGHIRSGNITGDRGEQLAIDIYGSTPGLPKLQMAPPSTKNIDAISVKGERYSIKTVSFPNKTTGVFHGYGSPDKPVNEKLFEYLIVVVLDDYQPRLVVEITWEDFYELKRWHSTMRAYNITLNKNVLEKSRTIYSTKTN